MKFVIAASQRSGSVFLENSLNSHPDVHCYGELMLGIGGHRDVEVPGFLHRRRQQRHLYSMVKSGVALRPARFVDDAYSERDEQAVGFRVMHRHTRKPLVNYLHQVGARVIFLERRNLLRQVVSRRVMHTRQREIGVGSAHSTSGAFSETIHLDPQDVLRSIDHLVTDQERSRQLFAALPSISLTYEDLPSADGAINSPQGTQICDFLEISQLSLSSDLVRTGGRSLEETVANFDQVADTLARSTHHGLLELA